MPNETGKYLKTQHNDLPIDQHGHTHPFIVDLLHNPPILPGESKEEFFDIYQSYEMTNEGDANTEIEFMLAWRATVLTFDVIRYERMKIAILRNQYRPATESLLRKTGGFFATGSGVQALTSKQAGEYYANPACKAKSDKQFEQAGFAPDAVDGRGTTTLAARMEDAVRVRNYLPPAPGSGAALCRGLRASSRRYHRPTGQIQQPERTQDWIGGKVTASGPSRRRNNWFPLGESGSRMLAVIGGICRE